MSGRSVFLMGLSASGKSRLGAALAAQRSWGDFVDSDREVERRSGRSAAAWIREDGIDAFREVEARVVRAILEESAAPRVLALGGGSLEAPGVFDALRARRASGAWIGVWLRAPVASLLRSLRGERAAAGETDAAGDGGERPPLTELPLEEEIRALDRRRAPRFARLADLVFATAAGPAGPILAADELPARVDELAQLLDRLAKP